MEQSEIPITAEEQSRPKELARPVLALQIEDVGNLDVVLRGYYLSQIKSLERRKDRKLARRLLEDHLVLPKSRQRTSKDAAYIKEILGVDQGLLEKLEESRLIRGIHKRGGNPIYEISHDTLVEPILSEKREREVIIRFIKKTWKYLVLLLLLWFLFGMLFENSFELLPSPAPRASRSFDMPMEKQSLDIGEDAASFLLPLPPVIIKPGLQVADSLLIKLPLDLRSLARLRAEESTGSDTISIQLESPLEVSVGANDLPTTYQTFSDVVVPIGFANGDSENSDAKRVYAKLSGNLKMTTETGETEIPREYNSFEPIEMELGDTLVQAGKSAKSIPVNFNLRLTDFFEDENDKNSIRNALGDREVKLNYIVQVRPAPLPPPPKRMEVPSVKGIEVQYSDGTSRFISGDVAAGPDGAERIHIVAAGETLFSIARQYGIVDENGNTSIKAIRELNGLRSNTISVGQALRIPGR